MRIILRRTFLFLSLFTLSISGLAQKKVYQSLRYRVALTLNLADQSTAGEEEILLQPQVASKELTFNAQEMTILRVNADLALTGWEQKQGKLRLILKDELPSGKPIKLKLRYRGKPTENFTWGDQSAQALYGSDHWMVCDMQPAALATLDLELILPATLQTAASGRLVSVKSAHGQQHVHWSQQDPVPPFVFGFAVGHLTEAFGREGRTTLHFMSEKHTPEQMLKIFASTHAALRFFEEKSGVELGAVTYTQVLTAGDPMQELAQMTVMPVDYGDKLLVDDTHVHLLAHELSHQWWGIRVPCADWTDFWLNEGMANFLADAFVQKQFGEKAYAASIEVHRKIYDEVKAAGKDRALCYHGWKTPEQASGAIAYHKGAYVLYLLREEVGDEAFWKGLRDYTRGHVGKPATSQELQHSMEESCGHSLQEFFGKWVYA